ncbi:MAG TPA: PAS domain S-box protein, partial [Allocoleopsis sp.]
MKGQLRATRNRIAKRFATALNRLNHHVQHWIETLETTPLTESTPYKTNSLELPGSSSPNQPIQQRAKEESIPDDRNPTQLNHQSPGEDLDRFFSVALDLLCIANLDGYFLQLNPLWEKTLGYTLEELKHRKFLDFVHPEDINSTQAALAALSEHQEVLNFVNRYRHQDGSYRWIEWRSIPVNGLIYASARDITEQKQAEAALRQSEAKNRAMLAAIPDLLLRIKLDGTCLDFIPPSTTAASNFLPIQSNVAEVLPPPVWQHQQQRMQQAFLTGELQVWTHQLLKNGCLCEEEVRLVPCGTDECLIIVRDITEQKRAEDEHKRAEEALRKSEERWQLAIEATNDGIWDHNLSTDEHFLSPRCMEILGYDDTDIDSFAKWLEYIHPEDQAVLQATFQDYLEHKTPVYAVEYRMRCKDGRYKWLLAKGKAFWDETGTPLRAIGSITDITSRKQAEVELQQLNEELEQRVQRRTQALRQAYAQLQDSEARFQTFMNNSPTVSWISDVNGVMVYVSQNYYHTFQLSTSDAVGQSIFQLYPQSVAQQFLDNIREVIHTHQVVETVTGAVRTDGTIGEFLSYTFPLSDSSGQCLMGGVAIDITERRQAEEAIRLSQEQLQLALEGSGDGLWDWNVVTGDTYLSPRWLGMLDYEEGELPATIQAWENLIHPEDHPTVMNILDAHLNDAAIPYQVEFRARSKTGEWRWVLDYGKVVTYTAEGQPLRMVGLQRDITDRKRAEDALRASETRLAERNAILQSVIESTPDVVFVKDDAGRVVIANTSFVRFFDQPLSALLGKSDAELWPPEMARQLRELDLRIMTTGIAETLEEAVPHPDGIGISTYLTTKSPWYDEQGNILGTIGLSRDISDRKLAEDALQAERLRLQLALDAAQMGTWSWNLQTNTLTWSDRTQEIFGFMPGTFPEDHETFLALVYPADRDRFTQEITRITETGAPYTLEYRIQRLDGQIRWIAEWGIIPQDSPPTDRQLIGVISDITERKNSEAALRDSEERFRVTFEQAAVGMVQVDLTGRFVRTNPAFCDIVGYSEAELSVRTFREITHPDDLAEDELNVARLFAGGIPSFVIEKRYIRQSGEAVWANLSVSLVRGVSGTPQYFIAVVENINDRKQAEQELRYINAELERRVEERTIDLQQAMESAEAANRAKSIFLANMSHELRTPLNVILGFTQLMTRDRNLPAEKRQQLSTINHSGEHLLHLINDILEMSKIEAGRISF